MTRLDWIMSIDEALTKGIDVIQVDNNIFKFNGAVVSTMSKHRRNIIDYTDPPAQEGQYLAFIKDTEWNFVGEAKTTSKAALRIVDYLNIK